MFLYFVCFGLGNIILYENCSMISHKLMVVTYDILHKNSEYLSHLIVPTKCYDKNFSCMGLMMWDTVFCFGSAQYRFKNILRIFLSYNADGTFVAIVV